MPPVKVAEPNIVPSVSSNVTVPEGVEVLVDTEAVTVAVNVTGVPGATVPAGECVNLIRLPEPFNNTLMLGPPYLVGGNSFMYMVW